MGVQERKARQKENLRQEILDAARDLFAHQGVESVSMRKIAERIEYSPGTIYLYFNDKNEILKTLCDETFSRLHQKIQAIRDDKSEPLSSLRRGLRAYIEFGLQNPNHYMVTFVLAGPALHEPQKHQVLDSGQRCFNNLRGMVRKCIEEGLFRIDDVEEASQVLWAGIHGITTLLITKPDFPFVEQTRLVERVVEVLVEGFGGTKKILHQSEQRLVYVRLTDNVRRLQRSLVMNFVAWQMLTGDRAKYLGLIFAIAFSSFLMSHQTSIFTGLMNRTRSQITDVRDAPIWVMDPKTQYVDEVKALTDQDLFRIRGVEGVEWAVPLYKGLSRARGPDGKFRAVILMGLDDASLVGAPRDLALGNLDGLREPDSIIVDRVGYKFFFPGEPLELGRTLEMNDRLVRVAGVANSSAPFQNLPVFYTRYSQAITYVGRERNLMSFVLVKPRAGVSAADMRTRVEAATQLKAITTDDFGWETIWYYIRNTGIPVNFGLTVAIALVVGTVVAGQTFYIFTIENLKQFGALKAIGVTNRRIMAMILLQAMVVGVIGYCLGMAMTATFFEVTKDNLDLRGFRLPWEIMAGTGVVVLVIVTLASLLSIRRVLVLEPAVVFRG